MKKSKLIELLSTFSKKEARLFGEFIQSPYHNKSEEVIQLWNYLERWHPTFPAEHVEKERTYHALFPGSALDYKHLSYMMNYLLKLGEQFITLEKYKKNSIAQEFYLMKEFLDRKLDKHFQYTYQKTERKIEESYLESDETFLYRHKISELNSDFSIKKALKNEPFLQKASDQFDDYIYLNKIKYACEMLNRSRIISEDSLFDISFIEDIENRVEKNASSPVIIKIYYKIYQLLKNSDDEGRFETLIEALKTDGSAIDQVELRFIYLYAINICIQNIRLGKSHYFKVCFDLYVNGIQTKALFENNLLTNSTFTNTIRLGLTLKEYDLLDQIINEHSQYLAKNLQGDAKNYNLALVAFSKEDYDNALINLNQMQFIDAQYIILNRVLMLKTYYETDSIESLLSLIASFTMFLKRNKKLSPNIKKAFLNFCTILNQLLRRNEKKKEKLMDKISKTESLMERAWLKKVWEDQFA